MTIGPTPANSQPPPSPTPAERARFTAADWAAYRTRLLAWHRAQPHWRPEDDRPLPGVASALQPLAVHLAAAERQRERTQRPAIDVHDLPRRPRWYRSAGEWMARVRRVAATRCKGDVTEARMIEIGFQLQGAVQRGNRRPTVAQLGAAAKSCPATVARTLAMFQEAGIIDAVQTRCWRVIDGIRRKVVDANLYLSREAAEDTCASGVGRPASGAPLSAAPAGPLDRAAAVFARVLPLLGAALRMPGWRVPPPPRTT